MQRRSIGGDPLLALSSYVSAKVGDAGILKVAHLSVPFRLRPTGNPNFVRTFLSGEHEPGIKYAQIQDPLCAYQNLTIFAQSAVTCWSVPC